MCVWYAPAAASVSVCAERAKNGENRHEKGDYLDLDSLPFIGMLKKKAKRGKVILYNVLPMNILLKKGMLPL